MEINEPKVFEAIDVTISSFCDFGIQAGIDKQNEEVLFKTQNDEFSNWEMRSLIHADIEENLQNLEAYNKSTKSQRSVWIKDLSRRFDVINKSILRSLKRFLMWEFKRRNKRIAKLRYAQTQAHIILNAFQKMLSDMIGIRSDIHEIAQFMMIYWGIHSKNKYPFDKELETRAKETLNCMTNYSHTKLQKVLQMNEFVVVFKTIIQKYYDKIIDVSKESVAKNIDVYRMAAAKFMNI